MNASIFRYHLKANKVILLMGDAPIRNVFNIVDGNLLRDLEAMRKVAFTIANGIVYDWSAAP
ncbi:MAG: hypothetical protein WC169_01330 [Dehalococcoidia bacterium]|jgi:hypothetical protein